MNERILTLINKNPYEQKLEFTLPVMYKISKAKDFVSGKEFEVEDNKIVLDVDGTKYVILKLG